MVDLQGTPQDVPWIQWDRAKEWSLAVLLREALGDELRRLRMDQGRTLREVSTSARVSLGYLSEVERGQKEASSELLAAICSALDVPVGVVLTTVGTSMTPSMADVAMVDMIGPETAARGTLAAA